MFGVNWKTSERKYGMVTRRDVSIPLSDGVTLDCDIFLPDAPGRYPAIIGVHSYDKVRQTVPAWPKGMGRLNGSVEAGDPSFFARRGYVHAVINVRGTGKSGGVYDHYGPREVRDTYEAIEWMAGQPWCDGNVGMFGASYYSVAAKQVACLNPPHLKAVFAPYGYTDFYRDKFYHGGILRHSFIIHWSKGMPNLRTKSWSQEAMGENDYRRAIERLMEDPDIRAVPDLMEALRHPDEGTGPLIVDALINSLDGPYWGERNPRLEDIKIPVYFGACWGHIGLHLPGEFRAWERISAPKKMVIGPPFYLDRPIYQYQYEALRWFDHWLKGMDTGIMEEPPVRLFVMNTGEWRSAGAWPLPETKWTPFYLHARGLLSEHEFWPNEGCTSFQDNPFNEHESIKFVSPPLVENTEVTGPIVLTLYAATTATDVPWFATLWDIGEGGEERLLTRGWLRGSLRAVDEGKSKAWEPFHPFDRREALVPGEIYEFKIKIVPTSNLFKSGHRIGLKISCVDDDPPRTYLEAEAQGHLWQQTPSWVTVFHDAEHPSSLLLPITKGNIVGTFISGGEIPV